MTIRFAAMNLFGKKATICEVQSRIFCDLDNKCFCNYLSHFFIDCKKATICDDEVPTMNLMESCQCR